VSHINHTPGPWASQMNEVMSTRSGGNRVWATVQVLDQETGYEDRKEAEANARLIAAAPELLAALQEALKHFPSHVRWLANDVKPSDVAGKADMEAYLAAVAAIAKATGGAP